jgi:hypothetical protein
VKYDPRWVIPALLLVVFGVSVTLSTCVRTNAHGIYEGQLRHYRGCELRILRVSYDRVECRVDHGPGAPVRFTEATFFVAELDAEKP